MITTEEGWHTIEDGTKLYTKAWQPDVTRKAKVIFLHGYSHHSDMHDDFFRSLASRGIEVFSFDQRGWGRSVTDQKSKGRTGPTSRVMADLHSVLLSHLPCPVPLFLLGHSMGGATMFTYACMGSSSVLSQISGFIGEAPDFGFPADAPAKPHRLTVVAGKIAKNFVPGLQVVQQLDATTLSRVVEEQKKYLDDPLCHDTVTLEGVSGHFDRVRNLVRRNVTLSKEVKSVWIGYGTKDQCTSYVAGKAWLEELDLQNKEFRSYEGALHSLHAEIPEVKDIFIADVVEWILTRSVGTEAEPVATD